MIEPITATQTSTKMPLGIAPIDQAAFSPRQHDQLDAERFSQLMEQSLSPSQRSPNIQPDDSRIASTDSLGDKMLANMSSLGKEYKQSWQQMSAVASASGENLSVQELLKFQMHMVKVSTEYDAIGKAIGKTTQNVDQMLHMQ